MDNKEVLGIFGYTDTSEITAEDRELYHRLMYAHNFTDPLQLVLYTTYLNIGVDGLQALEHYNFHNKAWGQVHHQVRITYLCPFPLHYIYGGKLLTRKKKKKN